jgi:hypothetical protein
MTDGQVYSYASPADSAFLPVSGCFFALRHITDQQLTLFGGYHTAVKRLCSQCDEPVYAQGGPRMDLCEPCLWALAQNQDLMTLEVEGMNRKKKKTRKPKKPVAPKNNCPF